jgi:hypothetical protein
MSVVLISVCSSHQVLIRYVGHPFRGNIVPIHDTKVYSGLDVQLMSFLISALEGGIWLISRPGHFTPEKPNNH